MCGYLKGFIVSLTLLLSMFLTPFALVVSAETISGGDRSVDELARMRGYRYHYGRPYGGRGRYYYRGRPGDSYRYRHYSPRRYYYHGYPRYRYRYYNYRDPYYYGGPRYHRGPRAGIYFGW